MKNEPVNISITKAQEELMLAIMDIQSKYEFPSYIIELIISSVLLDIKTCSNKELKNAYESELEKINNKESEDKKDGQ